jgi:predicted O-methyltransferase YrrM
MVFYNLEHLTQPKSESVLGPIQDTEALFLYSIVRGMRLQRILEIGGLSGYSAKNFLQAFYDDAQAKCKMYTVDINVVPTLARNHVVIVKNALELTAEDLENEPLDMIFFDCHDYVVQMKVFENLLRIGLITDRTVIALHDTHTHPYQVVSWSYHIENDGWVHQAVERAMVNRFVELGYHAFSLHTDNSRHDSSMPFRHGITIMQKFRQLAT